MSMCRCVDEIITKNNIRGRGLSVVAGFIIFFIFFLHFVSCCHCLFIVVGAVFVVAAAVNALQLYINEEYPLNSSFLTG